MCFRLCTYVFIPWRRKTAAMEVRQATRNLSIWVCKDGGGDKVSHGDGRLNALIELLENKKQIFENIPVF